MNEKISVLYIITKLELGGAQKVCLSLLDGVQNSGNNTYLISGSEGFFVQKVKDKSNVFLLNDFKWEVSIKGFFREIKNFLNLVRRIKKLKKENSKLIVHTHSTKAGLIGRWAAFFAGVKTRIHTVHCFGFHGGQNKVVWFLIYLTELFSSLITTQYICVSSYDVEIGKKLLPGFSKKYSIIRAAVNSDKFVAARKIDQFDEVKNIFVFGTGFKKQISMLDSIKAFKLVHDKFPNTKLEFLGDGLMRPHLDKLIEEYNLKDFVTFHGWQDDVVPIMIQWDAFLLTSTWEGLPCAIVESRLLNLPVISYKTGGIHDVIYHGKNGFLYSIGDWQSLAEGMIKVIEDKNLYESMKNYHDDSLKNFDKKEMIKQHLHLYKQLN